MMAIGMKYNKNRIIISKFEFLLLDADHLEDPIHVARFYDQLVFHFLVVHFRFEFYYDRSSLLPIWL